MRKILLFALILTLFLGILANPVSANVQSINDSITEEKTNNEHQTNLTSWCYWLRGRVRDVEIFEYNGTKYINATAIKVRGFIWNISELLPFFALRVKWNRGTRFCIPYEGANIIEYGLLDRAYLFAFGQINFN